MTAHTRQWVPYAYMDEMVPEPRATPQDWIVRLDDGQYALAPAWDWDGETDVAIVLTDGDIVPFCWTVILHLVAWSPDVTLPALPGGAVEWCAAPEDESVSWSDLSDYVDPGEGVTPYCWSETSVAFRFQGGLLSPVSESEDRT